MKLLIMPLISSVTYAGLWILLHLLGFNNYIQGDEGSMASGTVAFLAVAYALFAGFLFVTVWSQWVAVEEAVREMNEKKFDLHKDKRLPGPVKALLFMFSILLVAAFFLLSFRHLLTGGFSIFAVIIAVSTYWKVILDLDDPFTGIWNVQIPEEWKKKG